MRAPKKAQGDGFPRRKVGQPREGSKRKPNLD